MYIWMATLFQRFHPSSRESTLDRSAGASFKQLPPPSNQKNTKVSWPVWRFEVRTNQLQNCSASNLGMVSMLVDWKSAIDESKIFTLPNFFSNKGPSGAVLVKPQRNVAIFHLLPLKMHANQHGGVSIFHLFGVSHGPYDLHGTLL